MGVDFEFLFREEIESECIIRRAWTKVQGYKKARNRSPHLWLSFVRTREMHGII